MTFLVGRTEVRVSIAILLPVVFCIVAGETRTLLLSLLSLAVHETAHAIAARNTGFRIAALKLYPFGAVMDLDSGRIEKGIPWTVAAAGPLCSLAVSGALRLVSSLFGNADTIELLMRINLAAATLNALPAFPLDGGRILQAALLKRFRERIARRVTLTVTLSLSALMLSAGAYQTIRGKPAWILFAIPPFLLLAAWKEWRIPDAGTVARVMERKDAIFCGEAQRVEFKVVSDRITVGEALKTLSARRYTILRVRGEATCCELDEAQILALAAKNGVDSTLKTAISELTARKRRAIL